MHVYVDITWTCNPYLNTENTIAAAVMLAFLIAD